MRKMIKLGNPVNLVIMIDSIDAVFINQKDKKQLVFGCVAGRFKE